MAHYRIFTVGFDLPGDEFEFIEFSSDQTLLDADIILFEPGFDSARFPDSFRGLPSLDENSSFRTKKQLDHWRSEIIGAVKAGKIVIIYVAKPTEAYRRTGENEQSGTGRNARITEFVTPISSYDAVPDLSKVTAKSGSAIRITKDAVYLRPYWSELSDYSPYEAEIEGDFTRVLLKSATGARVVGAAIHRGAGVTLFLPPIRYDEKKFLRHDKKKDQSYWTEDALQFGKRLVSTLVALADAIRLETNVTPTPSWALESAYRLEAESKIESEITEITAQIALREVRRTQLETDLRNAGTLRSLLFEQGKPLEAAVVDALGLMGFKSEPFEEGESEFDALFVSPEGRCLGEAEGKDRQPVNIEKMSQLERNIHEDFQRDVVITHAKGVLFGNAHRLTPVQVRGDFFTMKCISAAKRTGVALVRTPDMFVPAKYLKEHPDDMAYATACREAIFRAEGSIVLFPSPPITAVESTKAERGTTEQMVGHANCEPQSS